MDMTKNPAQMTDLELSTAVYHISVSNRTAGTFTLNHIQDILSEASRRLRGASETVTASGYSQGEMGDSEPLEGWEEAFHQTAVITTVDNVTGELEQATLDLPHKSVDELREHIQRCEQLYATVQQNIQADWSFNPEDMEDLVGDPDEE